MSDAAAVESLEYAGFWIRFWAAVIDSILVSLIVSPLVNALYRSSPAGIPWMSDDPMQMINALSTPFRGPLDAIISIGLPAVAIIVFWIYKSATPGKMLVGAKIVDADTGGPISTGQAIGRYLGYYVSIFTLCIGFLWIAFDARKQGFHDKLAGTVVIRTRRNPKADFKAPPVNPG